MFLVNTLSKLIEFKSISPNDDGSINFLSDLLREIGFNCKKLTFGNSSSNKTKNLYAYLNKGEGPNFCFAGHVDVVPPGKFWKSNPFIATKKNGFIFGRGACDMKGAVAAYIVAIKNFVKDNKDFNGKISLILTSDEEGEAKYGTKKVVEWIKEKKIALDYCLVGEPTCQKNLGDIAKVGRRGSLNCSLLVKGKQGHVAYPDRAVNPITLLLKYLDVLKKPLDKGNKNFEPSNLEITSIDSKNETTNLIPNSVLAKFNIRFNNNFTSKTLISILKNRLDKIEGKYDLKVISSCEPFLSPSKFLIKKLEESIFTVSKKKVKLSTSGGTSDARFISKICPVIEFGAIGETMHKIDERIKISDLKLLSEIYENLLYNIYFNK